MVTDNQVAKQAEKNETLRQKIADLNTQRSQDEAAAANAAKLARLKQEEAALQTEYEYQKRLAKSAAVNAKSAAKVDEEESAVVAVGTNIQTPVENVGNDKKEK